ncbi:MAG: PEP-CTERM system TPR-repeat protein PrsT [Gammaproteobacteria bacterium]|nr:PEP-CTERM system TPR-repeat protein PrsT [Gammaproteobacteria bacterium]
MDSNLRVIFQSAALAILLSASCIAQATSADEYVSQAKALFAKGEIKSAVIELKNALQKDPSHLRARLMLGELNLRNADGAAAAKEFGRARDFGAAPGDWALGYARALVLQGDFRRLLEELPTSLDLPDVQKADLLAMRGNAHLALGEVDQAVAEYDAALELHSGNPTARLGKAQVLLANGQHDEALEQLNQVLIENPGHVESRLVRGDLLRRMQRLNDAEIDYAQAVEKAPNNPRARIGMALVHIAQRNIDAARKDLEVLNKIATGLPAVNYLQALVAYQDRDFDRASDELQVLLRVAPTNLQAQLLYGIVSYARGEYTLADDYLTRVLASSPGNQQLAKLVGAARLKLKQPERAAAVLQPVVNDDTQDAQLLALLGTALIQKGDNEGGSKLIERAVELDPDQALLRTQLAVGKFAAGETNEAISQLESAVALDQDVIQADVLLVLSYLNNRDYDKAVAASMALEQRMKDSPIPLNLTGLAYMAQQKFNDARQRFEAAIAQDPEFLVARMNLARLALLEQKPDAADAAYDEVLRLRPKHVDALVGKAQLARTRGDAAMAEEWLQKANQANPQALRPILMLAEIYLRQNEALKAINILSGLNPEQSNLSPVLRLRGMAQLQNGDYVSAIHTLKQLTDGQPESVEAWFQLARAHAANGDAEQSRDAFKRAIELDPDHKTPVVPLGLAELELRERRYQEALVIGDKLHQWFPDELYGLDVKAAAYRGMNDLDKALATMRAALERDRSAKRVEALARSLAVAGRGEESRRTLNDWLAENPSDGALWATLGQINQQMGRDDLALKAYEQSLKFIEPNAVLANNMAWLYLPQDKNRAVELATKAYELAPSRAEIVDTYGWVLFNSGRKADGLSALQQAMIIAPRNAEISLHVAEALVGMQRDAEARPLLERIMREHPNTPYAESARALIARLRG